LSFLRTRLCAGADQLQGVSRLQPGLLHCWYVDHAVVSLPAGHKFSSHKHRAIRRVLEGEPEFSQLSQFHPSPAVLKQDLLRVHPEDYIERFAAGRLSDKEMRTIGLPWSESMMRRQFHSCGGTLAACKALLAQPELKISGHLAGRCSRFKTVKCSQCHSESMDCGSLQWLLCWHAWMSNRHA
jgi:hypothetical protein